MNLFYYLVSQAFPRDNLNTMFMKKILLIDDDQDLLRSFEVTLENQGFTTLTANNGQEGLSRLQKESPDLLVLDVMMDTDLEGYNLLHKIKKDPSNKELPVILLTGMVDQLGVNLYSGVEDKDTFPNVHFHNKPVDPIRLGIIIQKILEDD